ncbi:hypothetical protein LVJ94_28155 [Pendulispora rubella]|uniref:Uncharacterized protein n=1 Tax=Pendulispora rubella TaxID=2741070 RepID=A0ABZ2KQ38_9BACT
MRTSLAAFVCVMALGCGDSNSNPPNGSDAGQDPCVAHTNDGPTIQEVIVMGETPAARGGTIHEGIYHLTAYTTYITRPQNGSPDTLSQTLVIQAGTMRVVGRRDGRDQFSSYAYTLPSETKLSRTDRCGDAFSGDIRAEFTATDGQFLLITGDHVYTYDRR